EKLIVFLSFFILLILAAWSDDQEKNAQDNGSKDNSIEEKEKAPESSNHKNTFPLTGIHTDQHVDNRIVSVMGNNHRKARPQSGLSKADIVFEILAEGQITRLLAIYQSELPDVAGPVRCSQVYIYLLSYGIDFLLLFH